MWTDKNGMEKYIFEEFKKCINKIKNIRLVAIKGMHSRAGI